MGVTIGTRHQVYGSLGKQGMEVAQVGNHLLNGRYLAYITSGKIGSKVFSSPIGINMCAKRGLNAARI